MRRFIFLLMANFIWLIHDVKGQELSVDSLIKISDHLMYDHTDSSKMYSRKALNLAIRQNSKRGIASGYQRLGLGFQINGDYDSAKWYSKRALALWKALDHKYEEALTLNTLGIIYDEQGVDNEGIAYYVKSLEIFELLEDKEGMARVYNNLGIINKKNERYDKVLEYYLSALAIYQELEHTFGMAATTGNIGSVYLETEDFDKSIAYSEQAIVLYGQAGIDQYIPYSIENLGLAYKGKDDLKLASRYHLEALELYRTYGNKKESAFTLGSLSQIKLDLEEYDSAELLANQSLELSNRINALEETRRANELLLRIHLARSGSVIDQQLLETYITLSDSLNSDKRNNAIVAVQTKYETEKKEQAITLLQSEAELKDQVIARNKLLILLVGIVGLLIGAFIFIYFRNKNFRLKAQILEERERLQREQFRSVIEAEEEERKRIAQDLHDGLGQLLSAARMSISSMDEEEDNPKVQNSIKLVDSAVGEVRSISHNMMPRALALKGLSAALKDQVARINEAGNVKCIFKESQEESMSSAQSTALFRVVQEVVNNALKYAKARTITIDLRTDKQGVNLKIEDDGIGFDVASIPNSKGIGWKNTYSRVDLLGGELDIISKLGQGTTVKIKIPNG